MLSFAIIYCIITFLFINISILLYSFTCTFLEKCNYIIFIFARIEIEPIEIDSFLLTFNYTIAQDSN